MRRRGALLGALLLVSACARSDVGRSGPAAAGLAASHSCVEDVEGASIRWPRLRNPIFSISDAAAKDVAVRLVDGRWRLLFSHVREDPFRFRIGIASSPDLLDWSETELWDQPELGGVASPDLTRDASGGFVVTYNAHTRDTNGENKLYFRRSPDFRSWSPPARLAFEVRPAADDRLIDAALAHTAHGLFLGYNYEESRFEMAWSRSGSIAGPWARIGEADTGPFENYQFLQIDGVWHLLGTTIPVHRELLYKLGGPPERPESWLHWELVRELVVPSEAWNSDRRDGPGLRGGQRRQPLRRSAAGRSLVPLLRREHRARTVWRSRPRQGRRRSKHRPGQVGSSARVTSPAWPNAPGS